MRVNKFVVPKNAMTSREWLPFYMDQALLNILYKKGAPIKRVGKNLEVESGYVSRQDVLPNGDIEYTFVDIKIGHVLLPPNKKEALSNLHILIIVMAVTYIILNFIGFINWSRS